MSDLRNIKDYITSLKHSELVELKEFIDLEVQLSETCIVQGEEVDG